MKVIALNNMTYLPTNCIEFLFHFCNLPMKSEGVHLMKRCNPHFPLYDVEVQDG